MRSCVASAPFLPNTGSPQPRVASSARLVTLSHFSQAVYLLFSAVYVCKESVEHVLLLHGPQDADGAHGAGHGGVGHGEGLAVVADGHGDRCAPGFLTFVVLSSGADLTRARARPPPRSSISLPHRALFLAAVLATTLAVTARNHSGLSHALRRTPASRAPSSSSRAQLPSLGPPAVLTHLVNPFTATVLLFSVGLLSAAFVLPPCVASAPRSHRCGAPQADLPVLPLAARPLPHPTQRTARPRRQGPRPPRVVRNVLRRAARRERDGTGPAADFAGEGQRGRQECRGPRAGGAFWPLGPCLVSPVSPAVGQGVTDQARHGWRTQLEALPAVQSVDRPHIWQLASSSPSPSSPSPSSPHPTLIATLVIHAHPHTTDADLLGVTRHARQRTERANERLRDRGEGEQVEVVVQVKRG